MFLSLFPRLAALGFFLLSSVLVHAASHDADAVPDCEQSSSSNRAILIPYDYIPSGLYDPDVDAQQAQTTGSIPLVPGTQANPLLSAIEKQRDEALKKAREGKAMLAQQAQTLETMKKLLAEKNAAETEAEDVEARLAQQAQEMAEMMDLLNSPAAQQVNQQHQQQSPQPYPDQTPVNASASETSSSASSSISVPRPVVSDIVIPEIARGYEEIYRRFLGGKLIYTDPTNKAKKELPIRALANPLEGTFDLSDCGDTGKYLSISTGYRKGLKAENANKIEIWLTPKFLANKKTAQHLHLMSSWNAEKAPVGVFWTFGKWTDLGWYDYLAVDSLENFGSEDLFEKWARAQHTRGWKEREYLQSLVFVAAAFHVSFLS